MGVNYKGLVKRETYDEIVDYLENGQEKIRYPNRKAKQLRESPYLTNLLDVDGDGTMEMEKQQSNTMRAQEVEHAVRQMTGKTNQTAAVIRSNNNKQSKTMPQSYAMNSDYEDVMSKSNNDISNHIQDQYDALDVKRTRNLKMLGDHLSEVDDDEENQAGSSIDAGGLTNVATGAFDVIKGGVKLGMGAAKISYKVGKGIFHAGSTVKSLGSGIYDLAGGNSERSSSSTDRPAMAFPFSNAPALPTPVPEALGDEIRRRAPNENPDSLLDEWITRSNRR
jgi:hypothetical protein